MAHAASSLVGRQANAPTQFEARLATRDSGLVKTVVLAVSLAFFVVLIPPSAAPGFRGGVSKGWDTYIAALADPDAVSAIKLTLLAAAIAVPLNSGIRHLGGLGDRAL